MPIVIGQDLDNLPNLVLEADLEYSIGLVDDERLEVLEDKGGVEQVVEQPARSGDEEVHALGELFGLGLAVSAANNDAVGL